tara:strand:- start:1215 stop:1484 length:270 start_codon:yes stop_codon:yes gene_type:complete
MPVTKSAKKALRQSERRKRRNLKRKNTVKDLVKQIRKLAASQQHKEATELLPKLQKAVDKAAKKGVLKQNTAARKKSRLSKLLKKNAGV